MIGAPRPKLVLEAEHVAWIVDERHPADVGVLDHEIRIGEVRVELDAQLDDLAAEVHGIAGVGAKTAIPAEV